MTEIAVKTPDQRLRVFVSSTLEELAEEREEVRRAVERLHLYPVMFELGARPHPPRTLYRAYLQQSHIFIGIYWQSYGWVGPDMEISGLEDEFLMSADMPRLIYLKEPAPDRQPGLTTLLDLIRSQGDASYKKFRDPRQLGELVADDIAILLTERFGGSARPAPVVAPTGRLPAPLTGLVGRDDEVQELCDLLASERARLITVTGPGGIGKTRCTIEAVARFVSDTGYETAYVALDAVRDPAQVLTHIASAVGIHLEGVPVRDTLIDYLAPRRHLLVLDNFEQVLSSGPDISALLSNCPRLKVLVSSRAPLRVRGEREYQLPPLTTPDKDVRQIHEIGNSTAVQLFCERAADIRVDFRLTGGNSQAVAEICRRLDGLPLAIELAAARVRLFDPEDLLQRITGRLDELSSGGADVPERHRALRAAIEWSYELLDEDDRRLFRHLAVFSGGWTLEAAQAVYAGSERSDVLEGLYSLAEKSLIRVDHFNGSARFAILETVRTYATERLVDSGESRIVSDRHARFFLALAEEAQGHLAGEAQAEWHHKLQHEDENLRTAIKFFLSEDRIEELVRIGGSIWTYWWLNDEILENRVWMEDILPRTGSLSPPLRGRFLLAVAFAAFQAVDITRAEPLLRDVLELLDGTGENSVLALTHAMLGPLELALHNDPESALGHVVTASSLAQGSDAWTQYYVLLSEGRTRAIVGEVEAGIRLQLQSLDLALQLGNPLLIANSRVEVADLALLAGDLELAREQLPLAAELIRGLHHREGLSYLLDARGVEAAMMERYERAAIAFATADSIRARIHIGLWPPIRDRRQPFVERAQTALGEAGWRIASERSGAMSTDEAFEFAAL